MCPLTQITCNNLWELGHPENLATDVCDRLHQLAEKLHRAVSWINTTGISYSIG